MAQHTAFRIHVILNQFVFVARKYIIPKKLTYINYKSSYYIKIILIGAHRLCRCKLLGVWCWEADQGAGVHQEFGPVRVWDPGSTALGPGPQLQHLLLQVRQLLEVQPPGQPSRVCPAQHAGLDRHPQRRGRRFPRHLRYVRVSLK